MKRGLKRGLQEAMTPLLIAGLSNSEIAAELTEWSQRSISVRASALRKKLGIECPTRAGCAVDIPARIRVAFENEALCRGTERASGPDLIRKVLSIIVKDNLFDAILGELPE